MRFVTRFTNDHACAAACCAIVTSDILTTSLKNMLLAQGVAALIDWRTLQTESGVCCSRMGTHSIQ